MTEIKMCRRLAQITIATGMMAGMLPAQSLTDQVNFRRVSVGGFRLYGVSVFSGYSTTALPVGLGSVVPSGLEALGGSANYGASASFGWQHHRKATDFVLLYSLSYTGMTRYSELNAPSQTLTMTVSRKLAPKWTFSLAGSAQDSTQSEFLHQPTGLSVLSQLPATIDDLAAAFSIGQFSSSQIASMFTGANIVESPARSLLLGNKVLSYSGTAGLNYAYSSRLSFHFATVSAGGQSRRGGQNGIPAQEYVLPRSLGMTGGVGMSYGFSPRTQLGLNVEGGRTINRYQHANYTSANVSFSRKMGIRWFLSVNGGGTLTQTTAFTYISAPSKQMIGGGAIGFRTYTQTLVGSYNRSSSAAYGFAVGTITSATGSWTWRRPGSRWNFSVSGGQNQIRDAGFVSLSGWEASGGISGTLTDRTSLSGQYVYYSSVGSYAGKANNIAVHSVRLSFGWSPQPPPQN